MMREDAEGVGLEVQLTAERGNVRCAVSIEGQHFQFLASPEKMRALGSALLHVADQADAQMLPFEAPN